MLCSAYRVLNIKNVTAKSLKLATLTRDRIPQIRVMMYLQIVWFTMGVALQHAWAEVEWVWCNSKKLRIIIIIENYAQLIFTLGFHRCRRDLVCEIILPSRSFWKQTRKDSSSFEALFCFVSFRSCPSISSSASRVRPSLLLYHGSRDVCVREQ